MASTLALVTDAEEDPSPDRVRPKIPLSLPREVLLLLSASGSLVVSSRKVSPSPASPSPSRGPYLSCPISLIGLSTQEGMVGPGALPTVA